MKLFRKYWRWLRQEDELDALRGIIKKVSADLEAEREAHGKTKGHVAKMWEFIVTRYRASRQNPPDIRTILQPTLRR